MSIADIKPRAVPIDLRVKIEHIMAEKNLSWRDTILFLAREVVSPSAPKNRKRIFLTRGVVSPRRRQSRSSKR